MAHSRTESSFVDISSGFFIQSYQTEPEAARKLLFSPTFHSPNIILKTEYPNI